MLTMRELNTNYITNSPNMANSGPEDPLVSSLSLPLNQLTKRCVIIQKDERGYGLRVSGESPVFVESVREGGAAWRAGVRPGDKIIKVSGTLVTHHHHGEVVRMIQSCGSYVGLTLLGLKTPPPSANMVPKPIQITGPQPASESTQQAYDENKVLQIQEMISKQKEHLKNLLANPKKNQKSEIEKTEKTIENLEKEIAKMTFDVTRHRHTSMSAENLTTGASNDPTIAGANANAKKSHSFGQYDTRAPIMTMESDEENDDFTNNNNTNNSRRNSSLISNSKVNYPEISDIPKTVDALYGHCLQMTRWLLTQDLPPHALLFYTMAGHVFPTLAAQTPIASRQSVQRLAWQIASTWLMKDSPLTFADFPSHSFDKFAETLESTQSSLEQLFDPFFETTKKIIMEQLDKWRNSVNIGLAPPVMLTAKDELQATIQLVLNDSAASLDQTVETLLAHAHVNNASTLALVTALLTIGHFVFACPSKHLLFSQSDSTSCPPINPVLKLSMESNKKHKRAVSCPNRNQSPGHNEAGHHFCATLDITKPIYCSGCMCPVWGTFGLTCAHCQMSVHNWCMKNTAANSPCPGPQSDNQSGNTTPSVRAVKKSRRWNSDRYTLIDMIKKTVAPNHDSHAPPLISSSTSSSDDDDDDALTGVTSQVSLGADSTTTANSTTPTPPNTITRSESFRQRRKTVPSYRKRSDPALTTSNSTLAGTTVSTDSNLTPDISGSPTTTSPDNWQLSSSDDDDADPSQSDAHLHHSSASVGTPTTLQQHILDEDTPPPLPPRPPSEKRKQIQNEILESEKRHGSVLRFINNIFYKPILKERLMTESDLEMVFCNVKKLRDVHKEILRAMRTPNKTLEQSLCDIFCGPLGQRLEAEASYFCAKQKMGGADTWRARKKDSKLKNFLDPELRSKVIPDDPLARLQLEDHLGTVFQRPLRYQLLLDRLLHATPSDSIEYTAVARALTRCREIGSVVNEATRRAESKQRLEELTRKTVKMDGLIMNIAEDNLVHEGPLTWRITKQKCVDVLLVLTDKILVILARDSNEKFVLKYHTNPAVKTIKPSDTNQISNKTHHSPIVLLHDLFTRDVATDPTAFFLISKDHDVFYEFTAATPNEKKQWKESILTTTTSFNLSKPNQTPAVTKLKDFTSHPSGDEDIKSKDIEEIDIEKEEFKGETEESNTSALTDEQNNINNSNKAEEYSSNVDTTPPPPPPPPPPKQSRFEGTIRYVSEEECRPPELISPTRVTISTEPKFEAVAVQSPQQRIAEIDSKIRRLMEEKRTVLANLRAINVDDQDEWNVVNDMVKYDEHSSSAMEVLFIEKAMPLLSNMATTGLTTDSYEPLKSLRNQIDALLARIKITSEFENQMAEQELYFLPDPLKPEQSSDDANVPAYF